MRIDHGFALACLGSFVLACGPGARPGGNGNGDGGNGGGEGGSNTSGLSCSSDLHNVLGPTGNVVETCPSSEGCANGACVPACDAAAASQGSVGCDFVVATPSFYAFDKPPCFAVFLANNWPLSAAVTITRGSASYSASTFGRVPNGTATASSWPAVPSTGIASEDVGVFFMSSDPSAMNGDVAITCPVTPAVSTTDGAAVWTGSSASTGIGTAFHITTSVPVSAYDIMPYGGADSFLPSAELLLPTTAWGSNYVTAGPLSTNDGNSSAGPGFGSIVASMDGTTVQIKPTDALPAGTGVVAAPAGTTTTYTLNAGQYVQWQDSGDMAGSIITSNHPVAYTGGTGYMCRSSATSSGGGCDSGHQMIPPVSALGYEYVAPPYATRMASLQPESIFYRVVGTVAGTTLTYTPAIAGAPTTLGVGQVVDFQTTEAFVITSQDACTRSISASTCRAATSPAPAVQPPGDGRFRPDVSCLGDEEFVNILPPAQWLSSYVFFTDPTYATTNLVVIRAANAAACSPMSRSIASARSPAGSRQARLKYQITNADIERNTPVGSCMNGRHTASSAGAFNIMVWGEASAASYAYPAGGNVGKINPVVVIQ